MRRENEEEWSVLEYYLAGRKWSLGWGNVLIPASRLIHGLEHGNLFGFSVSRHGGVF